MADHPTKWLAINNLPRQITPDSLRTRFSHYSGFRDVVVVGAVSYQHGIVIFDNETSAREALRVHGPQYILDDLTLAITYFDPDRLSPDESFRYLEVLADTLDDELPPRKKFKTMPVLPECPICGDGVEKKDQCRPCRQCCTVWCTICLERWFMTATHDHERMPVRCCQKVMHHGVAGGVLGTVELETYKLKYDEHITTSPLYCPVSTCSTFIPPRLFDKNSNQITCRICETLVCTKCKQMAEEGHSCEEGQKTQEKEDVSKLKYKMCPKCNIGVQKMYGCPHVRCQCGAHWCWDCQRPINACYRKPCMVARSMGEYSDAGSDEEDDEHVEPWRPPLQVNPAANTANVPINHDHMHDATRRLILAETATYAEVHTSGLGAGNTPQVLIDPPRPTRPADWQAIVRPQLGDATPGTPPGSVRARETLPLTSHSQSIRLEDAELLASMARGRQPVLREAANQGRGVTPTTAIAEVESPFGYRIRLAFDRPDRHVHLGLSTVVQPPFASAPNINEWEVIDETLTPQFAPARHVTAANIDSTVSADTRGPIDSGSSTTVSLPPQTHERNKLTIPASSSVGQPQAPTLPQSTTTFPLLSDPSTSPHQVRANSRRLLLNYDVIRAQARPANPMPQPSLHNGAIQLDRHTYHSWRALSANEATPASPRPPPLLVPCLRNPMAQLAPPSTVPVTLATPQVQPPTPPAAALARDGDSEPNLDDPLTHNWERSDLHFGDEPLDESFDVWGCRHKFSVLKRETILEGWMKDVEKYLDCMRCFEQLVPLEQKGKGKGKVDEQKVAYECKRCGVFWCKTCRMENKAKLRSESEIQGDR